MENSRHLTNLTCTRRRTRTWSERFVRSTTLFHWGRRGGSTCRVDAELLAGSLEPCHGLAATVHPDGQQRERQRADEIHHEAPAL